MVHWASVRSIPCGTTDLRLSFHNPHRVYEIASSQENDLGISDYRLMTNDYRLPIPEAAAC